MRKARLRALLHELYYGDTQAALRFQSLWIALDVLIVAFFIVAPFVAHGTAFYIIDFLIAGLLLLDITLRGWAFYDFRRWILRPLGWADLAVLASLIVPVYQANLGFLRVLRAYSLINTVAFWRIVAGGRWRNTQFAESIKAGVNLAVFVFMMAGLVHSGFAARVPAIGSYMDSLYFTVTALTTTGFGDIVLPGFWGRTLSITIMVGGVSLFFRLIQVAMRPHKVRHLCRTCGLLRHDPDAVHCKACGAQLRILYDND